MSEQRLGEHEVREIADGYKPTDAEVVALAREVIAHRMAAAAPTGESTIGQITSEAEWELELHRAAVDHLARCREAYYEMEEGDKDPADIDDPSFAPFCDCEDCVVREVLMASWVSIEERFGAEAEQLRRELATVQAAYGNASNAAAPIDSGAASGTAPEES
jgi:hypothetical protein